ncbi:hypothetical protein [Rhizobium sp. SG_E_25_P2]|uniref:hypothetical protein n=1 Tax=Rhizobium sp. SG_E_25_P2 TaxID=2879942 RepID=UPI002476909A|nr:hypothetical protein [Rhizobium sp. SG_E_25_P2]
MSILPLDFAGDEDSSDIRLRPFLPGRGQAAIVAVVEMEVGPRALSPRRRLLGNWWRQCRRRGGRRRIGIVVIGGETTERGGAQTKARRQCSAA